MDQSFKTSAAAICSALSETAQSTTAKVRQIIAAGSSTVSEHALQKQLSVLSARLQQLRQHVGQLSDCVVDASAICPQLGDVLRLGLADCHTALDTVPGSLEPGSGGLSLDAIICYETLVKTHLRFFIFATQLLIMEADHEQQSKLSHPAAQAIVDTARKASQSVLSFSYVTEN